MVKYVIMNAQNGVPVAVRETVEAACRCIEYLIAMGTQNTWSVCAIEEDDQLPQDVPDANSTLTLTSLRDVKTRIPCAKCGVLSMLHIGVGMCEVCDPPLDPDEEMATGWLIEKYSDNRGHSWWNGVSDWTTKFGDAIRYSRKVDAERAMEALRPEPDDMAWKIYASAIPESSVEDFAESELRKTRDHLRRCEPCRKVLRISMEEASRWVPEAVSER